MISGITVQLQVLTKTGKDDFNHDVYSESWVNVEDVLVAPMSDQEVLEVINLTGRKALFQLGIPKGDTHEWNDRDVKFWNRKFHVIGYPLEGISELIPLKWNKKVRVELYE